MQYARKGILVIHLRPIFFLLQKNYKINSIDTGWANYSLWANPAIACFCMAQEPRMVFTFLKTRSKEKRIIYNNKRKLHEIQISVSTEKILLEQNHIQLHIVHGCFHHTQQSWGAVIETVLQTIKWLLSGPLQKSLPISGINDRSYKRTENGKIYFRMNGQEKI